MGSLLFFFFIFRFALLIGNAAGCFASRLAGGLAFAAATFAVCEIAGIQRADATRIFAGLIGNAARGFTRGLAGSLAFTAAALTVNKIPSVQSFNMIHIRLSPILCVQTHL